jgi:4-hydroxy-3-polyprenylbenzoate decarboxylase
MMPPSDFSFSKCVTKAGMIWDEIERAGIGGVQGVWCHEAGAARMFNIVSIKQRYLGHARQVLHAAASCQSASYMGRYVVVVDEDIDPTNTFHVLWAISTRSNPTDDIDFIKRAWSGPLDPLVTQGLNMNSRALIDACRPFERLESFPPVARASEELKAKVKEKFKDILDTD